MLRLQYTDQQVNAVYCNNRCYREGQVKHKDTCALCAQNTLFVNLKAAPRRSVLLPWIYIAQCVSP
jgi:hypothetical protein